MHFNLAGGGNMAIGSDVIGFQNDKLVLTGGAHHSTIRFQNNGTGSAATDGTVIGYDGSTTTKDFTIANHENGYLSVYKHNESLNKEQGDLVKSGEVIATVGSTGELSSGSHLHFELWNNGYPVNPMNFMDFE